MKTKYLFLIVASLALAVLLGGCATGLTPSSWAGVTADADNAYIAGGPYVYAVNLQTGAQVWRYPAKASANPFFAAPVLTPDGQLIVGGFDHKLHSLDPKTGALNWSFEEARDRWIGGVLVADDMIYAPNADYNLYALDLKGVRQWTFTADQSIWGTPVSDGQRVYFGTLGRNVFALDAKNGTQVWDKTLKGAILGSPALGEGGLLYVAGYDGMVTALDSSSGAIRWQQKVSSWIWNGPALDGNLLAFGDSDGSLYALDPATGQQAWTQKLNGAVLGTPLFAGDNLAIGTEGGSVYFFDRTGKQVRSLTVTGKVYSSPVAAGTLTLFAPTGDAGTAILVAIDENGAQKWAFTPAK